jgi:hypothetical protein
MIWFDLFIMWTEFVFHFHHSERLKLKIIFLEKHTFKEKRIKKLRPPLKAWATAAQVLTHSFLDSFRKAYSYSTIQRLIYFIIRSERSFLGQNSIPSIIQRKNQILCYFLPPEYGSVGKYGSPNLSLYPVYDLWFQFPCLNYCQRVMVAFCTSCSMWLFQFNF